MITIPIWLFVILVIFAGFLTLIVGICIVSYVEYCHYKESKIKQNIDKINKGEQ